RSHMHRPAGTRRRGAAGAEKGNAQQRTRMQTLGRQLRGLLAGLLAGGLGGALVGIAESALVTWTSAASDEYWLVLFGVLAYGAIGAGCGLAAALAWQLLRRGGASEVSLAQVGGFAGMLPLAFAVAQYQINQRVFDEGLTFASGIGA